jgi:hypothetical protein
MLRIAALILLAGAVPAFTQTPRIDGLCLDLGAEGCTERHLPIQEGWIDFCEESCVLGAPTAVRGLEATLYDLRCHGDGMGTWSERVMILRQQDGGGASRILWLDSRSVLAVVPCPRR